MQLLRTVMTTIVAAAAIAFGCCTADATEQVAKDGPFAPHALPAGSFQVADNAYCHVVEYVGRNKLGLYGSCHRCITGPYSNTTWTTCPLTKQMGEAPDLAQCGQNTVSISAMCDDTGAISGSGGTIRVTAATLGANCGVPHGNVTSKVGAICNGKDECTLTGHDVGSPDPAPNCAKGFAVEWTCSGQAGTRSKANPPTTNETTALTLTCRVGSTGTSSLSGYTGGGGSMTSGTGRATVGSSGSSSISGYTGAGSTSGTGRATANGGGAGYYGVVPNTGATIGNQGEERDRSGRLTKEAARVYILNCSSGRYSGNQIYIYQYLRRPGFRAIYPGDWGHPVGGRDFATYNEAFSAACPW